MSVMERIFFVLLSSCTGRLCRGYETRRSETYRCRWSIFECFGFSFLCGFLTFRHAVCDGHCTSGSRRCPVEWICQLLRALRCTIFQGLTATIRALISHCTHTHTSSMYSCERSYRLWLTRSSNLQHTYTHTHLQTYTLRRGTPCNVALSVSIKIPIISIGLVRCMNAITHRTVVLASYGGGSSSGGGADDADDDADDDSGV